MRRLPTDQSKPNLELKERVGALREELDLDLCLEIMRGTCLTERQKMELLCSLWVTMEAFVDIGFGEHPSQIAAPLDGSKSDFCAAVDCFVRNNTGAHELVQKF